MYNISQSTAVELPSTTRLLKSTALAAISAGVLLITIVMPAEYGIDPTGIGQMLGLKQMGEIKMSLADEAAAEAKLSAQYQAPVQVERLIASAIAKPQQPQPTSTLPKKIAQQAAPISPQPAPVEPLPKIQQQQMQVPLAPNQGAEVKAVMKKGQVLNYRWESDGGKTNFDVHGDSKKLNISYHNYEKGSVIVKENSLTAAFDGQHGWFWRNRTGKALTVTLTVTGDYEKLIRVK